MKLIKRDVTFIHRLTPDAALKGACMLLPGALHVLPELEELPKELLPAMPAVILCQACDDYLERLLNQRGVAVTMARDPVDSIADGAEVSVDLTVGSLTEISSGRRFALKPLKPAHLAEIAKHG